MKLIEFIKDVGKPVAYFPKLNEITGSINATVFLCQLIYWCDKGGKADGWIYKSQKELKEETGMNRYQQDKARKQLKDTGFIKETLKGVPATTHYQIQEDVLNKTFLQFVEGGQTSLSKVSKPDCSLSANQIVEGEQTITENTTENTQESTSSTFSQKKIDREETSKEISKNIKERRDKEVEDLKIDIALKDIKDIRKKETLTRQIDIGLYFKATCSKFGIKGIIGDNELVTLNIIFKGFKNKDKDKLFDVIDYAVLNWDFIKSKLDKGKFVLPKKPNLHLIYLKIVAVEEISLEYPEGGNKITKKYNRVYI